MEQVEGLPASVIPLPQEILFSPIQEAENVVAEMPQPPEIRNGAAQASDRPEQDMVCMPKPELFKSPEDYYSTLFHELTHATGQANRLARKAIMAVGSFGSDPYAGEELVAEMGSAFLCGHCHLERQTLDQNAAYIKNWIARLRGDRRLIVSAAAQAQKACNFILDQPGP